MNDSTTPFGPWQTSEPVIDAYIGFLHLQLSTRGVLRVRGRRLAETTTSAV